MNRQTRRHARRLTAIILTAGALGVGLGAGTLISGADENLVVCYDRYNMPIPQTGGTCEGEWTAQPKSDPLPIPASHGGPAPVPYLDGTVDPEFRPQASSLEACPAP